MSTTSLSSRARRWVPVAAVTLAVAGAAPARPAALMQDSKSAAVAKELTQLLDTHKLDGIAAADPSTPGTFVAALYIQGTQLLVVSAKYAAPTLLVDKINKKEYRDVYIDLSSAFVAGTKIFIQDQNCDGFVAKPDGDHLADSWEEQNKTVSFEGAKKVKMTDEEYQKVFNDADGRYARILSLLVAQAKKPAPSA